MSTIDNSITTRFWAFVDKKGPLCKHIGSCCWIWKGGKIIWRIVSGRHFTADSDEFLEREKEFRARGGKFIFPLPKFEVV